MPFPNPAVHRRFPKFLGSSPLVVCISAADLFIQSHRFRSVFTSHVLLLSHGVLWAKQGDLRRFALRFPFVRLRQVASLVRIYSLALLVQCKQAGFLWRKYGRGHGHGSSIAPSKGTGFILYISCGTCEIFSGV